MPTQTNPPQPTPVKTTNQAAQDVVTVVENLVNTGVNTAETAIIAAEPWMGTPVVKTVWETAFSWLANFIMRPIASLSGHVVVTIEEYSALTNAASAQTALDAAKKTGDPNAIANASSQVDQAVAGVVNYIGATKS